MKLEYVDSIDVFYVPPDAREYLAAVVPKETGDPLKPYVIQVDGHVRNRDGYRTKFGLDIAKLRRAGAILGINFNSEGRKKVAAGELSDTTATLIPKPKEAKPSPGKSKVAS